MGADGRIGTRLGGRTLVRVLGAGGMATVYEAVHRNGHHVAIKVLHAALALSESARRRFVRESYVVNRIKHDGIVRIFDDGEMPDGTPYLVLELLRGSTVGALLKERRRLPLEIAVALIDQLLDVLASAHEAGVVHRDLKPDNLFVLESGGLKVLDFGIARYVEDIDGVSVHTQHGSVLGTPGFMAQEQARGLWSEVDERTDLWAVGATLFAMLAGERVHAGGTPNEQLGRAMTMSARSLGEVRGDLPEELVRVVDRALAFEPSKRWPSAGAMRTALRGACPGFFSDASATNADSRALLAGVAYADAAPAPTVVSELRTQLAGGPLAGVETVGRRAQRMLAVAGLFALLAAGALLIGRAPRTSGAAQLAAAPRAQPPAPIQELAPAADTVTSEPATAQPEVLSTPAVEPASSQARPAHRPRRRMLQTAPSVDADRRSPPAHVAPPPNLLEIRH